MRCEFCGSPKHIRRFKTPDGRKPPTCNTCRVIGTQFQIDRDAEKAQAAFELHVQELTHAHD